MPAAKKSHTSNGRAPKRADSRTPRAPRPRREPAALPFELRASTIQGQGAFATRRIRKGERIVEYTGERITEEEADARYDDAGMERHHTFLFSLDDGRVVDAAVGGNEARFINHSCEPNCEAVIVRKRIYIEAIRSIAPGTELCYDYAYERADDADEETERLYVCHCGSKKCRGTILAPKKKRERGKGERRKKKGTE
ncbi:MAG TPA: SET domain-containing protein-lysine N-methyltransferase [Gemmatimonadaceae bacterium]|nr:SET domain-containing protein-lysine N-methyltransferase [Gemmatimonadaceae bacterium]